jgi:aryl-alcohol dehydrogenase-like predicted oxidoreductase
LEQKCTFIDTAEVYNSGRSEELIGKFIKEFDGVKDSAVKSTESSLIQDEQKVEQKQPTIARSSLYIATKFLPLPHRLFESSLRSALLSSLQRLQLDYVDLYAFSSSNMLSKVTI